MTICANLSCNNTSSDTNDSAVSFHRFPIVGSNKLNVWLNYCSIENYSEKAVYRLCSEHFSNEQFKVKRTTQTTRRYLRPGAVPDIPYNKRALDETVSTEAERKRHKTKSTEQSGDHLPLHPIHINFHPVQSSPTEVSPTPSSTPQQIRILPAPIHIPVSPLSFPLNSQPVSPFLWNCQPKEDSSVEVKSKSKTWSRGTFTDAVQTREIGTQTDTKTEVVDIEKSDELDYKDNTTTDPDFVPYLEPDANTKKKSVKNDNDDSHLGQKQDTDEKYFLVSENSLAQLFKTCKGCGCICRGTIKQYIGTMVVIGQNCEECQEIFIWESQQRINRMPLGNLLLGSVILTSGNSPSRIIKLLNQMNTPVFTIQTYINIQNVYVLPEISRLWSQQQQMTLSRYKRNNVQVVLGGDSRCDSPGHCAKYGTYTLMDLEKTCILDIQLVQSNEVKNSSAMELEGLKRGLAVFKEQGVTVKQLVTDRHPQVKKYMREENADIVHYFDVWHMAKGVSKKLEASAKRKGCQVIQPWIKSVTNHMYWVAATSDNGEMRIAKWGSIMNHISDKHEGHSSVFPKCQHGPIERKWIKSGSRPFKVMEEVVMSNYLTRDINKLSPVYQTYSLEVFHNVINLFAPKSTHFFYQSMMGRMKLAAMHFNENRTKKQATTKEGKERYVVIYPKAKKGEVVVARPVKEGPSYVYVKVIKDWVLKRRHSIPTYEKAALNAIENLPKAPPTLSKGYKPYNKTDVIKAHKSRFN